MKKIVLTTTRSLLSLAIAHACFASTAFAASLQDELAATAGVEVSVKVNSYTGNASFLNVGGTVAIPVAGASNAKDAAIAFLNQYGNWFGVSDPNELLVIQDTKLPGPKVNYAVKFQQQRKGLDILGAQIIVRMDKDFGVFGVSSDLSSANTSALNFNYDQSRAEIDSLAIVSKAHPYVGSSTLDPNVERRVVFNPAVVGYGANREIAAYEVRVSSRTKSVDHMVYIDANTGAALLNYSKIHHAKNRIIYDQSNDYTLPYPNTAIARSEGGAASAVADVNDAYDFSGDTYDFLFNEHGRDSLDDAGLDLINVVRYCPDASSCPYGNAFWNGSFMTYGDGYATDDVVGHELAHGFTNFTSNLIYANESGAINESFSDVWGEFVDLTNSAGNDAASVRWLMGEDLPIGSIRDMEDPASAGDPDKITSSNYYCGSADYGGVHSNSGVNNKAASLMVDGGTFNGKTVTGLGISKTADIYYQTQTIYLTSGSGWQDLYNSLQASCSDLIGTGGITAADCVQVKNALDAVEMSQGNACVAGAPIEYCPAGQLVNAVFDDGFEGGSLSNWTINNMSGSNTWSIETTAPFNGTQHALGANPSSVSSSALERFQPLVPSNAYLAFTHKPNLEANYDGGVVEYSTDSGSTWSDLISATTVDGLTYNSTLSSSHSNPLGGRDAYSGASGYSRTVVDLSGLPSSNLGVRFHIGTDSSVTAPGWSIDDVKIYTCDAPTALVCNGLPVTVNLGLGELPTAGDDVIWGTPNADTIDALHGNDTICGEGGDDTILGGRGNDTILGGEGNDTIYAGTGLDTVYGHQGDDTIYGQGGVDVLNGAAGNDYIYGGSGADTINGGSGDDSLYGYSSADTINGNIGADTINGGPGPDNINGGSGNDALNGQGGADVINGQDGDDTITGGSGPDTIGGGAGYDSCDGQTGNDTETSCEVTSNFPVQEAAVEFPPNSSLITSVEDLAAIDKCDEAVEVCLAK